jgi:hypothetical protein
MGGNNFQGHDNRQGANNDQMGGQRRKNRVFAPVTMRMIQEASPRPDDVCEIEGEAINDVSSSREGSSSLDHNSGSCRFEAGGANAHTVRNQ